MNNEKYEQIIDEVYGQFTKYKMENLYDTRWDVIMEINVSDKNKPYFATGRSLTKEEFINKCKTDQEFSERWELKIEERELTTVRERKKYDVYFDDLIGEYPEHHETLDKRGAPRKIIIVTYNNETIEVYE
jgi:hypothetical protein